MKKTIIRRGETSRHRKIHRNIALSSIAIMGLICGRGMAQSAGIKNTVPQTIQLIPLVVENAPIAVDITETHRVAAKKASKGKPAVPAKTVKRTKRVMLSGVAELERLLLMTMWGEARGQGVQAMRAVGHVIMNRAQVTRFGNGVKGVIFKPSAFSCWYDDNREAMRHVHELPAKNIDRIRWEQAKILAKDILSGKDKDITSGATHYHAGYVSPFWLKKMKLIGVMYGHIFYKEM